MTQTDLDKILDACKPTPVMMIGSSCGSTPQENANRAWQALGERMGFDSMTVQPIEDKSMRFFTAVPNETTLQKTERLAREEEAARKAEITRLQAEILERQQRLDKLGVQQD